MSRVIRMAAVASTVATMLSAASTSSLQAQGYLARSSGATKPVVQGGGGAPMTFSLLFGIATGDGPFDMGVALGGSFEWDVRNWPVNLRVDPYFARHGGDCGPFDCDLTMFGAGVNAAYNFPITPDAPQWFIFGGLGLYHGSTDIDDDDDTFPGGGIDGDSETDLGMQIGGGFRFGGRYRLELRFMSVDSFDTIPILFGIRF